MEICTGTPKDMSDRFGMQVTNGVRLLEVQSGLAIWGGNAPQGYESVPLMDLATATEHHLSATSCSSADVWLHASRWKFVFRPGLSRAVVDVHTLRFQARHSGPQTLRRRSEGSTDGDLH